MEKLADYEDAEISIHAPTKGATKLEDKKTSCKLFQSTLPRRERLPISNERSRKITFQSTLPRRERQSRAYQYCLWAIISIHAPTKGATRDIAAFDAYLRDFNPRSHEGSDLLFHLKSRILRNFNPRSHEGSDRLGDVVSLTFKDFNPRSHEGSDSI